MKNLSKKPAFTMIELVFVVVVLGILAAVAIPRLENDSAQEASDQILSDIRYAQHLALTDNVTNPANPNWQRAFWTIRFQNTTDGFNAWAYSVASDKTNFGNFASNEAAIDPLSGLPLYGNTTDGNSASSPKVFITKKFGISNITFGGSCANAQHVGFDHMGRPHQSFTASAALDYSTILTAPCNINFIRDGVQLFTIQINPETGYAFRTDQPDM